LFNAENGNFFIKNINFVGNTPPLGLCYPARTSNSSFLRPCIHTFTSKGKAVPLQAWSGPNGSSKLRFPDFMTAAQDGGKVVSLKNNEGKENINVV
jgi:hypothetical protein